jgi:hypothetical protein
MYCRYLALESMCLLATSEFSHEAVKKHQETVITSLKVNVQSHSLSTRENQQKTNKDLYLLYSETCLNQTSLGTAFVFDRRINYHDLSWRY